MSDPQTNWQIKKLGEIALVQSGGTPARSKDEFWNGDIPWVKISDMLNDPISETDENISKKGLENSSAKLWSKGTILFSIFATLGRVSELGTVATANQAIAGITPNKNINKSYLKYSLQKIGEKISDQGHGVAQNNINLSILKEVEIPIPSFKIQEKIVERLDMIHKTQELNDLQISKTQELFKASLNSEINPKNNWPEKELGEVVNFLDNQRRPVTKKDRISGPYPYYGANGRQDSVADFIFNEELVLLAEDGGNFGSKDRPVAYRVSGKCWINNHAHVLQAKKDIINIDYLGYQLKFYNVTPYITGSTRAKLNKSDSQKIPLLMPSLPIQQKIVEKLNAIQDYKKLLLKQKELLKELFNSVLFKSINGELDS